MRVPDSIIKWSSSACIDLTVCSLAFYKEICAEAGTGFFSLKLNLQTTLQSFFRSRLSCTLIRESLTLIILSVKDIQFIHSHIQPLSLSRLCSQFTYSERRFWQMQRKLSVRHSLPSQGGNVRLPACCPHFLFLTLPLTIGNSHFSRLPRACDDDNVKRM